MYFTNQSHQNTFNNLLLQFPIAINDGQYQVACYVSSLPEIYNKISGVVGTSTPFDWYWQYLNDLKDIHLSSGYDLIAKAGLHIFNGFNGFNKNDKLISDPFSLYDAINTWGDELYKVFLQSLEIGSGRMLYHGEVLK
ncbi:DUF2538 family protein [Bacillus sp. FJAT-45350]|uniref:DUF2538 family protein n=1 Tax=Bacillus sp. FJAT-45350 TaxID=2011014 RepID=UPI000BB82A4C|nr:DUF2538 family protein [Bacillus sp. FJAT-45350]